MAALTNVAVDRAATRGTLEATPDGRALYEALGWQVAAVFVEFARRR